MHIPMWVEDPDSYPSRSQQLKDITQASRKILSDPDSIIVDTETTGLRGKAKIVEFAAISAHDGKELANFRVNPQVPIEPRAQSIHGISAEDVADAPTWGEKFPPLWDEWKARGVSSIVIYNSSFDIRLMRQSSKPHPAAYAAFGEFMKLEIKCAMMAYSAWCGEWQDWSQDYRWQKLPGGDHTALGDCHATRQVLRILAGEGAA
ncbi:3'-5' exonuclease [Nocardiopsis sp. NPDC006938]|uniref:3'-5' exonuclease n=1 Tax=Nocardiopsis sp. NPDC006938 TaxID=3364337 RepID=UPI00368FA81D